jgi:hypothetical protein
LKNFGVRVLIATATQKENSANSKIDPEKLVFIVPNPDELLKMDTVIAFNLIRKKVNKFVKLVQPKTEGVAG